MAQPVVEILIATYNGEKYLEAQIRSILNQTFKDFRILVSDDGSTDGTGEILIELAKNHPQQITVFNDRLLQQGVIGNFSKLIESSSAPYLMLCDQDDIWFAEKIQRLIDKIQRVEAENRIDFPILVHSDLTVVSSDIEVLDPSLMHYSGLDPARISVNNLLVQNVVTGGSCIFNRSLAGLVSPIPSEVLMHDWWLALIASSMGVIEYLPAPTGYYRQHQENVLGANSFGWKYIWNKFLLMLSYKGRGILNANIDQAKALKQVLAGKLDSKNLSILEDFISLKERPYFSRRWILIKNKFLKGRVVQNIGLFFRV